ncbi:MAG: UDP-N-acetylmuramoyl-L-alanine--D-glutamate ligase [Gammaproteobacteria bacterium]|nr:UDP-N-acetylmuramoyl-L-alanine--D-glutamate ligase [Gammaproteobacteria bacterium]
MVSTENNKQEYTLVVGLGITGLSVVRHLKNQNQEVVVVDSREQPPGLDELHKLYPEISVYAGEFDQALFMGASKLIVSPGVSIAEPVIQHAVAQGVEVVGDVELFAQQVTAPVIAITGSNGKSTVTTLVGEMAKAAGLNVAVGGNIGVPVLDLLNSQADLYVLELSSFQLETLHSLQPVSATVLNISPDHMDRYENFEHYTKVKQSIYQNCKVAVINRDDPCVKDMTSGQKFISGFTLGEPAVGDFGLREFDGETWLCKGGKKLIAENALNLGGRHNTANVLAALALGEAANLSIDDMSKALVSFTGLPHRTQWVAEIDGVAWYNDSKGTNVGATLAAIDGLRVENKLILIAGGLAKDADFSALRNAVEDRVRLVVLLGQDAPKIEQSLENIVPVFYAKNMDDAVHIAADLAHVGDSVLLSPACASFDMFQGFAHRGEVFMKAVEDLK